VTSQEKPTRHAGRRVARLSDVANTKGRQGRVPASAATIWRWVKQGTFPAPFKIGPNVTVWDLDEIDAFLAQRAGGNPA
jgi:prophage regulatory protein